MSPGFGGQASHSLPRPRRHRAPMRVTPGGQTRHATMPYDMPDQPSTNRGRDGAGARASCS
ncbi:hypothetical protein HMPREF1129_1781 [Actinomyces naeslundii str. Howell 279]|uniref:Uncharacterized protein n=1 Tax=Actinomyces naeslundii (strain ATCC 12104 / DSM 43013 / CCUG 2238 / JCM 8349 / NCTC 10301 / Howell 279) TaxID=1115803 RepID=J3F263_ACTNH|nr:hypothetical protein HMPREF1129_1781 [Actinomyces naeslundii str. Howell 279]